MRLTRPANHSTGRVTYGKPIKLSYGGGGGDDVDLDANAAPATKVSFSTHFSFALSPGNGDGLAFFLLPAAAAASGRGGGCFGLQETGSKVMAIVFGTRGPGSRVGIHIGNSSSILESERNASGFSLNSGQGFDCWIDYQGGSNRIEVWLTKSGNKRPSDPLLSYFPIDLSELWDKDKDKEVLVGLGSSNGNSTQTCSVYSWNFKIRIVPHWLHSQPYLPDALSKKGDDDEDAGVASHRHRSNCVLRFLGAVIFGTGCGALGAFFALLAWSILGERCRPAAVVPAPQEFSGCCPGEYEYKKIKVVVVEDKEGVAVGNGEKVEP